MPVARTGLIVGRFCPPHLGHSHLITRAGQAVDELVVFVNTRDGEVVPGELRASWLAELHPGVTVVELRHDLDTDFADEALWRQWIALFRASWPLDGAGPDVVFSSDPEVGFLEVWRNGQLVLPQFRPPAGTLYRSWFSTENSYVKTGYYRNPDISTPGTVVLDDWRIGITRVAVEQPAQ